jgi:hypothetical protein
MMQSNIINHFHHDYGFAATGAAEQAHLAATRKGNQQINNLDASLKHVYLGVLIGKAGGLTMNGPNFIGGDITKSVNRTANHVHDPTQGIFTAGNLNRLAGIFDLLTTAQTIGLVHGDTADHVVAEMLGNLYNQIICSIVNTRVGNQQGVQDGGQLAGLELHVTNRSDNLNNFSYILLTHMTSSLLSFFYFYQALPAHAAAPEDLSLTL